MSNKEIASKLDRLRQMKADIDRLQKEADKLAESIKAEMDRRGVNEFTTENTKATWKPVTSSRFDSAAFKASHAKMYANFTATVESRRFSVTAAWEKPLHHRPLKLMQEPQPNNFLPLLVS